MKAFLIDVAKCNGCHNCQISCKDEHCGTEWMPYAADQPMTGHFWCKVEEKVRGSVPVVRVSYTPLVCGHCDDAPCAAAAKDGAVYRHDDGLVVIDPAKAKGQRAIMDACPMGAIYWNEELNLPQKCTGCAHLLDDGWAEPRCVDACCTGALRFGEEEEFACELAKAETLSPELGTAPRVYYLNKPKRFVAATVVDVEADEVVEGARATLVRATDGETTAVCVADEFGDVWIDGVEPGAYRLWIQKEGYLDLPCDVDVVEKDYAVPELRFYREPTLP